MNPKDILTGLTMERIYTYAGPIGSPVPSAFALGMNLYDYMVRVYPAHPNIAALASIGGVIGIESTGALSAILVSKAYVNKDWRTAGGALTVLFLYIVFVAIGIYTGQDSAAMVVTVLITLLCYIIQALWVGFGEKKAVVAQTHTQYVEGMDRQIQLEREKTAQERAKARAAKLYGGQGVQGVQTPVQGVQRGLDADKLAKVSIYLAEHPGATVRDILKIPDIGFTSLDTANKYKHAAEEMLK